MKCRRLLVVISMLLCYCLTHAQADTVIKRYREYLLRSVKPDSLPLLATTYDTARQWSDIDYNDAQRANWQPLNHLKHLRDLAIIWSRPHTANYHDAALLKIMSSALDHWLQKRYTNSNWWHNQIGVPRHMRDIIVLLRDVMTADQLKGSLEILHQLRVQKNGQGANLVWSADLGLHYGLFTHNDSLVNACANLLVNEINITTGDGVQPDHSFHQHSARLQMYQYGSAFLKENIRIAWQLRNTQWAYPEEKKKILVDFVLEGWQWMARGIHTVPGTIDRSVSRPDALQSADLRDMLPYLLELSPVDRPGLAAMAREQEHNDRPLEGFRYFPYSDFAAFQNKYFSFFLKTISTRTLAAESINSENIKGHLMNSGDGYIIRNGREYFNMMPVWNWEKLPGITSFKGADSMIRMPFSGSVSDGRAGLTAMDYAMKGKHGQKLTAKKLWAYYQNTVVCLIAALHPENIEGEIYTVLDQCRQQGEAFANIQAKPLRQQNDTLKNVSWLQHNGIAYLLFKPSTISLTLDTASGSWSSINASGPRDKMVDKVYMPMIIHKPGEMDSTGYAITYCAGAKQATAIASRPSWKTVLNNRSCQAVRFGDHQVMAAFYEPGSLHLASGEFLQVDHSCLILISNGQAYASDPSHGGASVKIKMAGKSAELKLPADGSSVRVW